MLVEREWPFITKVLGTIGELSRFSAFEWVVCIRLLLHGPPRSVPRFCSSNHLTSKCGHFKKISHCQRRKQGLWSPLLDGRRPTYLGIISNLFLLSNLIRSPRSTEDVQQEVLYQRAQYMIWATTRYGFRLLVLKRPNQPVGKHFAELEA